MQAVRRRFGVGGQGVTGAPHRGRIGAIATRVAALGSRIVPAIVACLLLSACLATPVVRPGADAAFRQQSDAIAAEVAAVAQTGDWLVIRGYHGTDHLVANATGLPLSHVAVYDQATRDTVEADATGVHASDLTDLVGRAHRVLVIRPRWRTDANAQAAWQQARSRIGQPYDFLGTVGLGDDERFYCTELAFDAYRAWFTGREQVPRVIRPGELYLWGAVLYDSMDRDERADGTAASPPAR